MAMYRSYEEAFNAIQNIDFTHRGKYTSRSDFASKARYWSESTFKRRVSQARYNYQRRIHMQLLKRTGFTPFEADKLRSKSEQSILDEINQKRREVGQLKLHDKEELRRHQWKLWAKYETYPSWIKRSAKLVNNALGIDEDEKYGWAVLFYSYTRDIDIEDVVAEMKVDITDPDLYVYALEVDI